MTMTVQIQDAEVKAAFARMLDVGQNPRRYLGAIGGLIKSSTQLRFNEGRSPSGSPWAAVLRGGKPLLNTGVHLRNAVNYQVDANSVTVGVPFWWARTHQEGRTINARNAPYLRFRIGNRWARKKSVTIPARPFLGISSSDERGILSILRKEITGES